VHEADSDAELCIVLRDQYFIDVKAFKKNLKTLKKVKNVTRIKKTFVNVK